MIIDRRSFLAGAAALAAGVPTLARAASPTKLGIDYAYYNPPSLVLRKFGWLEAALKPAGTEVEWVLSLGSNKANQFLSAGAIEFGSTAGSAALLARANGSPIRTVFLYSQPEWTALVVRKDSTIRDRRGLKGKKIAATRGTDPWFFLIRSLRDAGLDLGDIELVDLQHPDGRVALGRGEVDAWAGLDPHMASAQLDDGAKLLYRNRSFNTYGALNVREDLLRSNPQLVNTVLAAYRRAHEYARSHVEETAKILAEEAHIDQRVALLQLRERTAYPSPVPGSGYRDALRGIVPIVQAERLVADPNAAAGAVAALIGDGPARGAHAHA